MLFSIFSKGLAEIEIRDHGMVGKGLAEIEIREKKA